MWNINRSITKFWKPALQFFFFLKDGLIRPCSSEDNSSEIKSVQDTVSQTSWWKQTSNFWKPSSLWDIITRSQFNRAVIKPLKMSLAKVFDYDSAVIFFSTDNVAFTMPTDILVIVIFYNTSPPHPSVTCSALVLAAAETDLWWLPHDF